MNPCVVDPSGIIFKDFKGYNFQKNFFEALIGDIINFSKKKHQLWKNLVG
jgi:hypothetical protein